MSIKALETAEWLVRPETQAIFAALDGAKRRTRAVGGVVRDTILGRQRNNPDIDLATELLPDEVIARAEAAGIAHYPTGIDHGTVTLKLGETLAEVTTLRRDVETDGRHAVVAFGTSWVEDASRRDFTLNALYCAADGTLFDPLKGVEDALAGRVRFIGDANQRIEEDGLRVYRFFRFTASHGAEMFDEPGLVACAAAAGKLEHLSAERVGSELLRMLGLPKVALTLTRMVEIGLLAIDATDLNALVGYELIGGSSPTGRLALLARDDLDGAQSRWRLSGEAVKSARQVLAAAALIADGRVGEAAYRHADMAVEGLAVAAARGAWGRALLAETARELAATVVQPFPINGRDLADLGVVPGPGMGQELARLERVFIESGFALDKSDLLAMLER